MRIFIDIGGHKGHSVLAALDPIFSFDKIYSFEPNANLAAEIRKIKDPRLTVICAGLGDRFEKAILYRSGTLSGSFFQDGPEFGGTGRQEVATVLKSGEILPALIPSGSFVRIKLNCEGAEIAILQNLIDLGCADLAMWALIDFDAEKIPSLKGKAATIEQALRSLGISWLVPSECQRGMITNYGGVRNYLFRAGAGRPGWGRLIRSLVYNARMSINSEVNGYHKMKVMNAVPGLRRIVSIWKRGDHRCPQSRY